MEPVGLVLPLHLCDQQDDKRMQQQTAEKSEVKPAATGEKAEVPRPEAVALSKLNGMDLPGLPFTGRGVLTTPQVEHREVIKKAIAAAQAATPAPADSAPLERMSLCFDKLRDELRTAADTTKSEYLATLANKVEAYRTACIRCELGKLQVENSSPLLAESLRGIVDEADKRVGALTRDLAENHGLLPTLNCFIGDGIAGAPVVAVDGKLEFDLHGKKYPVVVYHGPGGVNNGCVIGSGMTMVNLDKCRFDQPGGLSRVRAVAANELAHAYLKTELHFPSSGELASSIPLGNGPAVLDELARKKLGEIKVVERRHVHELLSDHWSSSVDKDLGGEIDRMLEVAFFRAVVDRVEAANENRKSHVFSGTPGYAVTSAIISTALDSIDRANGGRTGWNAELVKTQKIASEMEKAAAQIRAIQEKLDRAQELAGELSDYLKTQPVQGVIGSVGKANRDEQLEAVQADVRKKVLNTEVELGKLIGGRANQYGEFVKANRGEQEELQKKLFELNKGFQTQISQSVQHLSGKLNAADRNTIAEALAHYAKITMPSVRHPVFDDLKIPPFPLP